MEHPDHVHLERTLKRLLDEVDDFLEENYGSRFRLHPARAARGATSSKSQDGLFGVHANFSLGIGSEHGDGYVLDARMSTLEGVPDEVRENMKKTVYEMVRKKLPEYFPNRDIHVDWDGDIIKIHGDMGLGTA